MDILAIDEIFTTIVCKCSIDVLYGLYCRDSVYEVQAMSYFGLSGLYIGIKLRDSRVLGLLCNTYNLPLVDNFKQFITMYDNEYLFKHNLPIKYIEVTWNDDMDVEKHLTDAASNLSEEGIDFILTRERLWMSVDHISLIVINACEDEVLCKKYIDGLSTNQTYAENRLEEERVRRGLVKSCDTYDFSIAVGNNMWDIVPSGCTEKCIVECAILEGNMGLVRDPIVPDHVKSNISDISLSRDDILFVMACAIETNRFNTEMLEYFGISTDELWVPFNVTYEYPVPHFSVFCELRDRGYLVEGDNNDYSPYHYLYDIQRDITPKDLDYSKVHDARILFALFRDIDTLLEQKSEIKYKCAERMFEIMRSNKDIEYFPYIIRKVCEWNVDFVDMNREFIEGIVHGDTLMKEWYVQM